MLNFKPRRRIERLVWELGGEGAVSQAMDVNRATVRYWITQDRIPAGRQADLVALADQCGLSVKLEDLIGG